MQWQFEWYTTHVGGNQPLTPAAQRKHALAAAAAAAAA
eukprot:COSAG06_NODE_50176_length_320_cov_1.009050_1_plen_37_part_10